MSPTVLKTLSDGTLVAGIHSIHFANLANFGNLCSFVEIYFPPRQTVKGFWLKLIFGSTLDLVISSVIGWCRRMCAAKWPATRSAETSSSYSSWTSHFTNLIHNCIPAARRVIEKVHACAAYQAWVIWRGRLICRKYCCIQFWIAVPRYEYRNVLYPNLPVYR